MADTFKKNERLSETRIIGNLFKNGHSFNIHPLRVTWIRIDDKTTQLPQVMISVPKAVHPLAHNRNMVRRRIREAYRLNKSDLGDPPSEKVSKLAFCITYTSKEILSYSEIRHKIILLLRRLKVEGETDT
jgi:ribonuclease P protein component